MLAYVDKMQILYRILPGFTLSILWMEHIYYDRILQHPMNISIDKITCLFLGVMKPFSGKQCLRASHSIIEYYENVH